MPYSRGGDEIGAPRCTRDCSASTETDAYYQRDDITYGIALDI